MGLLNSVACFRLIYRHRIFPNHTPFQLSWIFSIQRACLWAFGPLYGRLCDMYGPRVVIWPLVGTCAVQVFAMSLLQEYWYMMETQGILFGIAAGGVYTASLVSMGQWFDRRLGLVAGIAACGSSLGGIVYPLLLQCAMEQANFENAMQHTALLIGIVLLPALFLIKERLPITGWNRNAKWFDLTLFRQRHYPYFIVGSFLTMWGYWAPIDYIMEYALDSGSSPLFALLLLPSMSAASIPGHVIFGHLGDRLGHDAVLTLCSSGLGASYILWVPLNYTQSAAGIFVFTLAFGFLSGGFISLLMPCVARLGSAETLGQRLGSFQFFMAIRSVFLTRDLVYNEKLGT
ncbi:uncharacterized protein LDX57_001773 [Aspergillus melleus]|uniref:uncharacterized protein n=1 Tax=Aspergillus melleus TaxID=138277 RepID=UPI001E8EA14F|nr:uncharacterized protein LDX57_001773 [Aspergillus melleus]KAH8424018.1 hypothetical protein LDX57_001773 [Aspergillus melleus]